MRIVHKNSQSRDTLFNIQTSLSRYLSRLWLIKVQFYLIIVKLNTVRSALPLPGIDRNSKQVLQYYE